MLATSSTKWRISCRTRGLFRKMTKPLKHTSQAFVLVECNAAYVDRRVLAFGTNYWSHFQGSNTLYIFHFCRCHSGVFHPCDSFHVSIFLTFTLPFRFSMPHAIFSLLKFSDFCALLISWLLHFIWRTCIFCLASHIYSRVSYLLSHLIFTLTSSCPSSQFFSLPHLSCHLLPVLFFLFFISSLLHILVATSCCKNLTISFTFHIYNNGSICFPAFHLLVVP